ncbi:heme exporter protein CcmD [Sphingomonas sp. AP4-R1]|nr:heme exporter protein CcmD [Sphingomonas sp. AP4-R1]
MGGWPFVIAAYAVAILATVGLVGWSWRSLRQAEARAERLRDR